MNTKKEKRESRTRQLQEEYNKLKNERLQKAKSEPTKARRLFAVIWVYITIPFIWLYYNIRDTRTFCLFLANSLVISSEVWVPLLIGIITNNEKLRAIGLASWAWWCLPGTPFLVICIAATASEKALIDKIKEKKRRQK